jgi:hypothetical protein
MEHADFHEVTSAFVRAIGLDSGNICLSKTRGSSLVQLAGMSFARWRAAIIE